MVSAFGKVGRDEDAAAALAAPAAAAAASAAAAALTAAAGQSDGGLDGASLRIGEQFQRRHRGPSPLCQLF
jgi:hypothetical protein